MKTLLRKIAVEFLIVFCCSSVFAKMNLRVNVAAGPLFSDSEFQTLATGGTFDLNYDFNISQTDSISAGIDAGMFFLFAYTGLNFSYIHCLNPDSPKNYKWNLEAELHGGTAFWGQDYVELDGAVGASWEFYPAFNVDVLFTLKPKGSGFYFGAGPSCAFVFIHDDKKSNLALCPGIMLTGGFRF